MSLSAEQLQALDDLPPPASLDRILRFLSDLGAQGGEPLGTSGRSAQAFAASLAGGMPSFSARQVGGWAAILVDRYQIKLGEIQEFALWFVQRQEIFSETPDQVVQDPGPALARLAAPDMALANPPAPATPAMALAASAAELSAAPRTTLRRQAVAPPPMPSSSPAASDDAGTEAVPTAPSEDLSRRRQKTRAAQPGTVPRGRRIERGPSPVEATDAPDSEAIPEESAPPPRRPFRLAPRMITRPAFVTNVGLAGMLAGLSLGGTPAAAMDAPAMALAGPSSLGLGPAPGTLPTYGPMAAFAPPGSPVFGQPGLATMGAPAPTVTPAFSPLVTPMTPAGVAPPPHPVWLGMPPATASTPASVPAAPIPALAAPALVPGAPNLPAPGALAFPAASPVLSAPQTLDTLPGISADTLVGAPSSASGIPASPSAVPPAGRPGSAPTPPDSAADGTPGLSQSPGAGPLLFNKPLPLAVPPAPPTTPGSSLERGAVQGHQGGGSASPFSLNGLAAGSAALSLAGRFLPSAQAGDRSPAAPNQPGGIPSAGELSLAMPPSAPPVPGATWNAQSGGWNPATPTGNSPVAGASAPSLAGRFLSSAPNASGSPAPAPASSGLAAGSAALSFAGRFLPPASNAPGSPFAPGGGLAALGMPLRPQTAFTGGAPGVPTSVLGEPARSDAPSAAPFAVTPEMGQMTLLAPPLQIASAQSERAGTAASVDWTTLAGGIGPLDEGGMARLKGALPAEASVLYPALPPGSLGKGAVNLPLSAPLVQSLLRKGYGQVGADVAARAADMGAGVSGGKPPAAPLQASLVPTAKRPAGSAPGLLGHVDEAKSGAGALAEAGRGQAARGGALDFLGLPVRLAPSLGGGSGLARETAARNAGLGPVRPQQTLRPERFAPLRNRVFPAFHSMTVEPDKAAWRKAAPALGLRDTSATTLLSPDARVPMQTPTAPHPASRPQPSASSPSAAPRPLGLLSPSRLLAGHKAPAPGGPGHLAGPGHTLGPGHLPTGHPAASVPRGLLGAHRTTPGLLSHAHPLHPGSGQGAFVPPGTARPLTAPHSFAPSHHAVSPAFSGLASASHRLAPHGAGSPPASGKAGSPSFPTLHRVAGVSPLPLGQPHLPSASAHLPSASAHLPSASAHLPSASAHLPSALAHSPSGSAHKAGASPRLSSLGSAHKSTPAMLGGSSSGHAASASSGGGWTPSRSHGAFRAPAHTRPASGSSVGSSPMTLPRFATTVPLGTSGHSAVPAATLGSRFTTPATPGTAHVGGLTPLRSGTSLGGSVPGLPSRVRASSGVSSPRLLSRPHPAFRTTPAASPHGVGVVPASHLGSPSPILAMPAEAMPARSLPASHVLTPQVPQLSLSMGRGRSGGVLGSRAVAAPTMRFAPARGTRRTPAGVTTPPMTIQRATTVAAAAPARRDDHSHAPPAPAGDGAAKSDVNALAGEVYSLIKRRLAVEADRRGRW